MSKSRGVWQEPLPILSSQRNGLALQKKKGSKEEMMLKYFQYAILVDDINH
uniref:Uncharacterized protein n=1 Tax=Arundo donax TaxID=35708 RepID=A0A0A9HIA0_ARUDO